MFPYSDPARQEEQRQASHDRQSAEWPKCGCCGHTVNPGDICYDLKMREETIIVCADCRSDMELSERIFDN